jgi:HD-like signal output (HDOD) protein/CheY-like chemotaxis protein
VKRILFVDDEKNILDGIRRMFNGQRDRWDMHFALSGEAALQACERERFDLVISDMRMPGMDGATLLGEIRNRFPDTARLVLSGYSETALATRAAPVAYRVLGKPCNRDELQSAIERVCALQDLFCTPEIRKIIGTIGEVPSLSSTYTALASAMRDPATSIDDVTYIIESDVAMAAKVLQLVNSGFFGLAQSCTILRTAVEYLGMDTMKNLALASDTFRVFVPNSATAGSFCQAVQRHSHRTAVIAGTLPFHPAMRDIIIISALLHDIGRLVIASKMPNQFNLVRERAAQSGCADFEAEEELLGTSHAEIGAYLLGLWGLHGAIIEAVAHHHHPTRVTHTGLDASAAVYVSNLLAHELEAHPEDLDGAQLLPSDRACLNMLGLVQQYPAFRIRALEALN